MQPVSITIRGQFWDSQLYSGELLLFGANGDLHKIDWASVIDNIATQNERIQTAIRVAFVDSDLFYTEKVRKILRDPQVEEVIRRQLSELALLSVESDSDRWARQWKTVSSPFPDLPADTDVYYNHLFAASDEGLFSVPRSTSGSPSSRAKHHDGRVMQIKASNRNTAVAAAGGADGLIEFDFQSEKTAVLGAARTLARIPCNACEWALQSIMAWGSEASYLASFRDVRDPRSNKKIRTFDRVVRQEQILDGYDVPESQKRRIWGSHEKVFCISESGLEVLDYEPPEYLRDDKQVLTGARFMKKGVLPIDFNSNDVIATGTAPFGTVLELDDRVMVLRSDGRTECFQGEVVHWRVFPRSENYSNQLHLIYEDRIQVISFMHDYFVDQESKLMGFSKGRNSSLTAGLKGYLSA